MKEVKVTIPIPINQIEFYNFSQKYELLNKRQLVDIMDGIQNDLMESCFKVFRNEDIKIVSFNQSICNSGKNSLIHIASNNSIISYHPFKRNAIIRIPAYSRRILNSFLNAYKEQGPLEVNTSLVGFKGFVCEEIETINPLE